MDKSKEDIFTINQERVLRIMNGTPDFETAAFKVAEYIAEKISRVVRIERSRNESNRSRNGGGGNHGRKR